MIDYSVLNYNQLLKVNGAKGGSGGGGPSGPSGPSDSTSSNTNSSSGSGKGGSNNGQTSPSGDNSNEKNSIDNTNNPVIKEKFTSEGYELLSDKKDSTYTEGSRKEYMQSEFQVLSSDTDSFTVVKKEGRFEGVTDGQHSYNDYDIYTIVGKENGKVYMEAIDVDRDGKIDYAK